MSRKFVGSLNQGQCSCLTGVQRHGLEKLVEKLVCYWEGGAGPGCTESIIILLEIIRSGWIW